MIENQKAECEDAEPVEIGAGIFATGQDDQVGGRDRVTGADEDQVDVGMGAQRIEIGMVGNTWEYRYHDAEFSACGLARLDCVFGVQE